MEEVKYNIAIQTYMEVFDYLISNDLFVFDIRFLNGIAPSGQDKIIRKGKNAKK